jgi:hypothetical protein
MGPMKESTAVWIPVRTALAGHGFHLERIEMRSKAGLPDLAWSHLEHGAGWTEFKWESSPPGPGWKMSTLKRTQVGWIWRFQFSGRAGILCRAGDVWLFWYPRPESTWIETILTDPLSLPHDRWVATDPESFADWLIGRFRDGRV